MRTQSQRVVPPCPIKQPTEVKTCQVENCKESTFEGKPYCCNHVKNHPYVQALLAQIANREIEDAEVRKNGSSAVNVDQPGITLREILRVLKFKKTRTEERLEKDLQLPRNLIHSYCVALQKRGIVKIKMKPCGRQQVTFLSPDDPVE